MPTFPWSAVLFALLLQSREILASWEEWWTYDGISGPSYWGLLNPEWKLCNKGKRQSPVDIDPRHLLYDPHLKPLNIDQVQVTGTVKNTGHSVIFRPLEEDTDVAVNITGGPLSYRYRFHEIHVHYGRTDGVGSEHTVANHSFPAEIQIIGYNSDLYNNLSEALTLRRSEGVVGIAILLQIGDLSNSELRVLTKTLLQIVYRGQESSPIRLSVHRLLPKTEEYMTYDGSLTFPGCEETVTWIVFNRPIYITKQQMFGLRKLMQGDEKLPKAPLGNNYRPPLKLHHRPVRTNIDFKRKQGKSCPTMYTNKYYAAKSWSH